MIIWSYRPVLTAAIAVMKKSRSADKQEARFLLHWFLFGEFGTGLSDPS